MICFREHLVNRRLKYAACDWKDKMNSFITGTPVLVPVSQNSAVIEYEQDHEKCWCFFFFPVGNEYAVFLTPDELERSVVCHRRRNFRRRVERARHEYRMHTLAVERDKLADGIVYDPKEKRG
jgi:hypothetical protein